MTPVIIFLLFQIIAQNWAQYLSPIIVRVDKTKIVDQGQNIEFSCWLQNYINDTISWTLLRKNQSPKLLTLGNTRITADNRFTSKLEHDFNKPSQSQAYIYKLYIDHVINDDFGNVTCQITSLKKPISMAIELRVRTHPMIGEDISKDMVVNEGSDVLLKCNATGYPQPRISWKRADIQPLPNGDAIYRGNVMLIKNITKADRGRYICVADNDYVMNSISYHSNDKFDSGQNADGLSRRSVTINVEFAPSIPPSRNVKRNVGQAPNMRVNAALECFIEAFPAPHTWWAKVERGGSGAEIVIENNHNYEVTYYPDSSGHDITVSRLNIIEVQNEDFGLYKCYASNTRGVSSLTFTLYESSMAYNQYGGYQNTIDPFMISFALPNIDLAYYCIRSISMFVICYATIKCSFF
ncbi:unnamed protein product [Gordionus sp. m RMFG-2023]|uniref:lachesin-like n=1 Tax=Gordionus sp. m RMFG-2023 TaxID=3053472 RepID=UPI0030DEEE61